ncbi:MAG: hypothetical protein M3177_05335 [Pseudomonadota bacterium]|nr:hypothetical protein [Pseudomonadota bacterium]
MPKPPATPPSSDIDGVHQDEALNKDSALQSGQDSGDLERARDEAAGKPDFSDRRGERPSRDDRSG